MDQTEKKTGSVKRTRELILQIIAKYEKSHGLTVKEFCQQHGISEDHFIVFEAVMGSETSQRKKQVVLSPLQPLC
ncbi:hypothetical protein [Paraflavitalea speifideaquila]|uniref:hypothetical protein n=1 Tax=Paraflavitalea speifideaquila TaxID=3076558 RepID=UPI0028EEE99F|nr:hypothetical protein [Paraflavitalea speifideiaquila]